VYPPRHIPITLLKMVWSNQEKQKKQLKEQGKVDTNGTAAIYVRLKFYVNKTKSFQHVQPKKSSIHTTSFVDLSFYSALHFLFFF
jgi:uncharacterized protein YlbG (UPF0298 family)